MTARLSQLGLTPKKAALMAVLLAGLVAVWGPQLSGLFGESRPAQTATANVAAPTARPTAAVARNTTTVAPQPARPNRVPSKGPPRSAIGLADALAYDPFAPPAWSTSNRRVAGRPDARSPDVEELEARFDTLRESGVAMILVSGEGKAVQIGTHTLQVGDRHEGFEVVEITARGVVFRPALEAEDDRGA